MPGTGARQRFSPTWSAGVICPPRPGVARIVQGSPGPGLGTGGGVHVGGALGAGDPRPGGRPGSGVSFSLVLAGDVVKHKKPAPDIYELAVARLGSDKRTTLAIEDSRNGLLAATSAGLACVITVSAYSDGEDFGEAALVVSSLGEVEGEATKVLSDRANVHPGDWVTLEDLEACMAGGAA